VENITITDNIPAIPAILRESFNRRTFRSRDIRFEASLAASHRNSYFVSITAAALTFYRFNRAPGRRVVLSPDKLEAARSWPSTAKSTVEGTDNMVARLDSLIAGKRKESYWF
jgi:hypothetical protein